jgi:hypothetical protein
MKTKILFLLAITTLLSCKKSTDKSDFIGIWESFESHHQKVVLTFYKDSLILDAFSGGFHSNSDWDFDENKIYLKNIREGDSIIMDTLTYGYRFNKDKDTLKVTLLNNEPLDYSTLHKVDVNPFTLK